jgi:hypothetical protein
MAVETDFLWRFKYVKIYSVAAYAIRWLMVLKEVNSVTFCGHYLYPSIVIACMAFNTQLVIYFCYFDHMLRVISYYFNHVT